MTNIEKISIKALNYKCFGVDSLGFEQIKPINLIIGRNNSGKSTLLDLMDYVTDPKDISGLGHLKQEPKVILTTLVPEEQLSKVFERSTSGGPIKGPGNHWAFGRRWVNCPISWEIRPNETLVFHSIEPPFPPNEMERSAPYPNELARKMGNPFQDFTFKRLLAERNIKREKSTSMEIDSEGGGVTNAIQNYLNDASLPSELIEQTVLNELNHVFGPDSIFDRILVQKLEDESWEIYLEESKKGRIPLSHTGSGIKTILLVAIFLHLIPHMESKPLEQYLFGFEELENNLHPALQRRLLLRLREYALERGCRFFLTTHSSVAIDLFSTDESAQIIHVTHDGVSGSVKSVVTAVENRGILDDLDIRASDLLQSNCVIWVEGPSDRLYFNRWIELWSDGRLKEGAHYQCVFYGGRLLYHLSASDPDVNIDDVIRMLNVNRNAIILIDSDKGSDADTLNDSKERLICEIKASGNGMAWVTQGREIENYLPEPVLRAKYGSKLTQRLQCYQRFSDFLNTIEPSEGGKFSRRKVLFAEDICMRMTKDDLMSCLDLPLRLEEACRWICKWNGLIEDVP